MQKVRSIEILTMEAEFLRDDNDDVWFSTARDIQYRWCKVKQIHPKMMDLSELGSVRQRRENKEKTELLVLDLETYMRKNNFEIEIDQETTDRIRGYMQAYFD